MQRDCLELLVVLARLEGRRKRQIVGGSGELDTGGGGLVSVQCGTGDGLGLRLVRNRGVQDWGCKGRGKEGSCQAWTAGGGVLAGHGGLGLWPAGWAPPGQAAGPERVGSGPREFQ
jgi:hypothetical protein